MATLDGIKVYYPDFDEVSLTEGISRVTLTKNPAVDENFIALSKKVEIHLSEDRQLVTGPLLVPDKPILRGNAKTGLYYIVFTKDVIAKYARNLHLKTIGFNYEHQPNTKVDGVLQEIWLTGKPDKSESLGFDLPEGSLMATAYIKDKSFWLSDIKTKNVLGFSIEAISDLKTINMTKIELSEIVAKDGTLIKTDSETIDVGIEVYTMKEGGEKQPIPDGEYDLGNGTVLVIKESKVAELKEAVVEETAEQKEEIAMRALITPVLEKLIKPYQEKIEAMSIELSALKTELENMPGSSSGEAKKAEVLKLASVKKEKTGADILAEYLQRAAGKN